MNRKGFTLIELLAVIVVLAIIAVIVIPIISNIITTTKKQAFKQTTMNILKASEIYAAEAPFLGREVTYPIEFVCNGEVCSNGNDNLSIGGEIPLSGKVVLESIHNIYAVNLSDGVNCFSGTKLNLAETTCSNNSNNREPSLLATNEGSIIRMTYSDTDGIVSYCITRTSGECIWDTIETDAIEYEAPIPGTYYCYVKDALGNIGSKTVNVEFNYPTGEYGLFDYSDNLIISFEDLVNNYGLDITRNYTLTTYNTDSRTGTSVFTTNNLSGVLKLPSTLTRIGDFAFYGCPGIYQVDIPNSLNHIGKQAFKNSNELADVNFNDVYNWHVTLDINGTGDDVDVHDPSENALMLTSSDSFSYSTYYWKKQ